MAEIVTHDFGKEGRDTARRFARLFGIVEEQERDVLANPLKHLRRASDQMCRLSLAVRDAQDLLRQPVTAWNPDEPPAYEPLRTVNVMADEYERLKAAAAALKAIDFAP